MLPRLWRFAWSLSASREPAEDLVQATCERALSRESQFQPGTRLDHWLFSIMASIWKNELRSRSVRFGQGHVDAEEALVVDPASQIEGALLQNQVLREVARLPEAQRSAILLVYVEGLSYREAAQTLEIPIGTLMGRLSAAKSVLAERLQPENGPAEGDAP